MDRDASILKESPLEEVTFRRGPSNTLPSKRVPGTLLVETDTGTVFLDDTATNRIQLKDPSKLSLSGGTIEGDLIVNGSISTTNINAENGDIKNLSGSGSGSGISLAYGRTEGDGKDYTISIPAVKELSSGTFVLMFLNESCDEGASLALNAFGAKPIYLWGEPITKNAMVAHGVYGVVYDQTDDVWHAACAYTGGGAPPDPGGEDMRSGYGDCDTSKDVVDKTVTIPDFELGAGAIIAVRFINALNASSTLNVNGTGAVPIFYQSAPVPANLTQDGDTITMIYDGHYWHILAIDRRDGIFADEGVLTIPYGGTGADNATDATQNLKAYSLSPQKEILVTDNMDTFINPGSYKCTTRASAAPTSSPLAATAGLHMIWVIAPDEDHIIQTWYDTGSHKWYERSSYQQSWTGWASRDAIKIPGTSVMLMAASWDSETKTQQVTCKGVDKDETTQLINWMPGISSIDLITKFGIQAVGQGDNTLTFRATSIPDVNIFIYVTIQEVQYTAP